MSRSSRSASIGAVLLAGALVVATAGGASGSNPLPGGTTTVPVAEDGVASSIDAHVQTASSIEGTIRASGGGGLGGVVVALHDDAFVGFGFADSTGHYEIDGLGGATPLAYSVCVAGYSVVPAGATGYVGRCHGNVTFNGVDEPSGTTKVTLGVDQHPTGIDITLPPAAAVRGTVRSTGGSPLGSVLVAAHNRSTGQNVYGYTRTNGTYEISGLTPSAKGYSVCFDPHPVTSGTGFLARCYRNKAWGGGSTYPSTATSVSVKSGQVHTGINQRLARGGAISGRVTDAATGKGVGKSFVEVFSARGKLLGSASADSTGRFRVVGLAAASGDRVCAVPRTVSDALHYRGTCWRSKTWSGGRLPSGTTPVAVHVGSTHTGIRLRVAKQTFELATVAGTVTQRSDDAPLANAEVSLFKGTQVAARTTTDSSGHYSFGHLRAGSGYAVCATGANASGPTPPATGWAPRCHADVAWDGVPGPTGATTFSLSAGQHKTGVGVALRHGGEIDGTVVRAGGSTPAGGVEVEVFTPTGHQVATGSASPVDGTYAVRGLSPGTYVVCFDGRDVGGGIPGYLPQCYQDVAWQGLTG